MEHPRLSARPVLPSPASSADQQHPTVSSPGCQGCPSPHTGQKYRLTSYWPGQASLATFPISKNKTILGWLLSFQLVVWSWSADRRGAAEILSLALFNISIKLSALKPSSERSSCRLNNILTHFRRIISGPRGAATQYLYHSPRLARCKLNDFSFRQNMNGQEVL